MALLPVVAFVAFVSLGLPDGVLGVAWPSVRATFDVPLGQLGLLLGSAMAGYIASSFSAGWLVARIGVGRLLAWSSVLMVANCLGYALAPGWPLMVACGVLSGLGAGAIDAGINAFAAARFPASLVSWLHASYGVGAMLGPLLMTVTLAAGLSWRFGYAALAAALAGMAACFFVTRRLRDAALVPAAARDVPGRGMFQTLARPAVWWRIIVFFLYTGLEVTAGQWSYTLLTEARGVATGTAGTAVAGYWAGLTVGRVITGAAVTRLGPRVVLRWGLLTAPVAAALVWADAGTPVTVLGLIVLGVALGPIYPMLIAETPRNLSAGDATHAIGFQICAAYLGSAAVPGAAGMVASVHGVPAIAPFIAGAAVALVVLHEASRTARAASAARHGARLGILGRTIASGRARAARDRFSRDVSDAASPARSGAEARPSHAGAGRPRAGTSSATVSGRAPRRCR